MRYHSESLNQTAMNNKVNNNLILNTNAYSFKEYNFLSVECTDWDRVKKCVERLDCSLEWFSVIASILAGSAASTCITWLSGSFKEERETILICVMVFCTVIAIILFVVSKFFQNKSQRDKVDILDEMKTIESKLQIPTH